MEEFFKNRPLGSGKRALKQSLEKIDANIKWIHDYGAIVDGLMANSLTNTARRNFQATSYDQIYKYGRP